MTPFQERVVAEKTDLDFKLEKLRSFIREPFFLTIDLADRTLLAQQEHDMACYSDVLARRIARFG